MGCNASEPSHVAVQHDTNKIERNGHRDSLKFSGWVKILNKKRLSLEEKIQAELAKAKTNRDDKKVALMALKRKKGLEKELSDVNSALLELETPQMMYMGPSHNIQRLITQDIAGFDEVMCLEESDELQEATYGEDSAEMAELMEELNELSQEEKEEKQNNSKEQDEENLPAAVDETETTEDRNTEDQKGTKILDIQALHS